MPDVNEDAEGPMTTVNNMLVQLDGVATPIADLDNEKRQYLEDQLREARRQQRELNLKYPYMQGGRTVLGPEVSTDGRTIRWKDETYVPQSYEKVLRDIRAIAGIHCEAMLELLHDAGLRLPDNVLHLYMLLKDELTLTVPALAQSRPHVVPRLPEGMQ